MLEEVAAKYGVPARFIVALWGRKRFRPADRRLFGRRRARDPAYDGRRSAYFRRELLDALRIIDRGDITPAAMKGSWAGAMGQSQFMPSSFLRYAVDYNGDGRRDIWSDGPDLFASIANYLSRSGWRASESWGREVLLPADFDPSLASLDIQSRSRTGRRWACGVPTGGELYPIDPSGSVLLPGGAGGPAYIVFENFRVLLKWNKSNYFASAVGLLADGSSDLLPAVSSAAPPRWHACRARHRRRARRLRRKPARADRVEEDQSAIRRQHRARHLQGR